MKKMTFAALTLSMALIAPAALVLADTTPASTTAPATPTVKKSHKGHKKGVKKAAAPAAETTAPAAK